MKNIYIHIDEYGNKFYYKDKKMTILHREDGPAVILSNGNKEWWFNGMLSRMNGPAVELNNGHKEWYINGEYFTEKNFLKRTSPTIELTLEQIADKFNVSVDKLKIKK